MLDSISASSPDRVRVLWSVLREQGFDAAERLAVQLVAEGAEPQLLADLRASVGRFEEVYDGASRELARVRTQAQAQGTHHARLALFADALCHHDAAQLQSELAVAIQPLSATIDWIVWLINDCGAHAAAAHMLRAYERCVPQDARAPWWLAIALTPLSNTNPNTNPTASSNAQTERRAALARAYALDPSLDPALPLQLVLALREVRDWPAVGRICRERLACDPADAEMAWQLSHAQWQCNDAAAAEATMRAVDAVAPGNPHVMAAIGMYLAEQARYAASEAALHAALALDPDAVQAAVDLADLELRRGAWTSAWPRFEARLARDDREPENVVNVMARWCPHWQGEALTGKTLVVHSEQGSGDDIQMLRFVPAMAAQVQTQGGRLVLAVRRALQPLFARFHADCVAIEDGPCGNVDYALPIMSLPLALDLHPEDVHGAPYLHADARKLAAWRERIEACAPAAKHHVGLVWSGSTTHRRDAKRSIPLAALRPLLTLPDIAFHPLTPGRDADVAALSAQGFYICDLSARYADGFDDVAAHLGVLDALVTIDSAPLHLGGALGRPVFAMLDHVSHWAWGNAEVQPWYDSVTLFRQAHPGDWGPVVERVVARLRMLTDADRPV